MIALTQKPEVDIEQVYQITQGLEKSILLFTAMDLNLFDCTTTPKTAPDIAAELQSDSTIIVKFLNALVATGFLVKEGEQYSNSLLASTFLVKGEHFYQGNLLSLIRKGREERWGKLKDVILNGPVKIERPNGVFDNSFVYAMAEGALRGGLQDTIHAVRGIPEFAGASSVLDLGGGHGLYAIGFVQAADDLTATVFDLPGGIDVAIDYINRYGLEGKISTITGDFTKDDFGTGYDIIFASDVFYRPQEDIRALLEKVKNSLNPGGVFISKHWTIDEERTSPVTTVLFDLMLSLNGSFQSHIFTDAEFTGFLAEMDFKDIETVNISTPAKPSKIIIARK